jgi:hypothetical protein
MTTCAVPDCTNTPQPGMNRCDTHTARRRCAVDGCERTCDPGWARCVEHVDLWFRRVFSAKTQEAIAAEGYEFPRYEPEIDELESRVLDGNR